MLLRMTIQPIEPKYSQAVSQLLQSTILASPHYNTSAKSEESAAFTTAKLEDMPSHHLHLATENNILLGVLVSSTEEASLLWLNWIVVSPEAQRRGVAGALIAAFHRDAAARGLHKTWCDSRVGNTASARMLEKAGYNQVATLTKHWYGLDYFIWERFL